MHNVHVIITMNQAHTQKELYTITSVSSSAILEDYGHCDYKCLGGRGFEFLGLRRLR